jgi:hypothetical protein
MSYTFCFFSTARAAGDACGLADDHVLRFHSQGDVRNMACRKTYRNEKVFNLPPLRKDHSVRNLLRFRRCIHLAFVLYCPVWGRDTFNAVRVALIRTHSDGVRLQEIRLDVSLGHCIFAQHSSRFSNVELPWPSRCVYKFILRQTIRRHSLPQGRRNTLIMR